MWIILSKIHTLHQDYKKLKGASILDCAYLLADGALTHNAPHNLWLPQTEWLKGQKGSIQKPDFLGRMENLPCDLTELSKLLGLDIKLPSINRSYGPTYRKALSSKVANMVGDVYQDDVDFFGYEF